MTQPLDIITSALSSIGALAPGEPLAPELAADAFLMLNDLLDMWSNDAFTVISVNEIIGTISGATDWTIGPTGQIVGQRPLAISSAFVRVSNIDYPVAILNIEQYELISMKQLNGPRPRALWYNSGTPNGVIKFWPLPSAGEIHLFCDQLFTRFTTINDTVQLPQGYAMAMRWALALLLMPGYGKTDAGLVSMVKDNARQALASIKGTNMQPQQTVQFDPAMSSGHGMNAAWVYSGGF